MKAIVLISGGLDSLLAAKVLAANGIDVMGINFLTPFTKPLDPELIKKNNIPLKIIRVGNSYLKLIKNPKFGFGRNINPCIDCHIFMLKKARKLLKKYRASFVATGEVLGQRPMSQNKGALKAIEDKSGLKGLLLRPLSARLLDRTIPEEKGWIDRKKLYRICGRGRKEQLKLAKKLALAAFNAPAGGCLLTDPIFADKLKDLLKSNTFDLNNVKLLKLGRHFRLNNKAKLIVGRDKKENNKIPKLALKKDLIFMTVDVPGPIALLRGDYKKSDIRRSYGIVACFSDHTNLPVKIKYHDRSKVISGCILAKPSLRAIVEKIKI